MKVLVKNELIDLSKVTSVQLNPPRQDEFDDSELSTDDTTDWMWSIDITFINNKNKRLTFAEGPTDDEEQRCKEAYNNLLEYWSPNQIEFPVIC